MCVSISNNKVIFISSYIESLCASNPDPKLHIRYYARTRDMDLSLGLSVPDDDNNDLKKCEIDDDNDVPEVMIFPANCSHCNAQSDTKMHIINIPHFKEVVIMATNCDVSIFNKTCLLT